MSTHLGTLGKSDGGSVCVPVQPSAPSLRLADERPQSHTQGHLGEFLDKHGDLCLSSHQPFFEGSGKSCDRETQTGPDSLIVTGIPLVFGPYESGSRGSSVPQPHREDSRTAKVGHRERESCVPKLDRLATIKQGLVKSGLSEEASSLIMKARRDGTNTNYNYKWSVWVKWCEAQTRKVDPLHPKVRHVADFLARLYVTRKLSHASFCNYGSTIAFTIKTVRELIETPFFIFSYHQNGTGWY